MSQEGGSTRAIEEEGRMCMRRIGACKLRERSGRAQAWDKPFSGAQGRREVLGSLDRWGGFDRFEGIING